MAYAIHLALRKAIDAAKFDNGPAQWYQLGKRHMIFKSNLALFALLDGPAMNEAVQNLTGVTSDDFYL